MFAEKLAKLFRWLVGLGGLFVSHIYVLHIIYANSIVFYFGHE